METGSRKEVIRKKKKCVVFVQRLSPDLQPLQIVSVVSVVNANLHIVLTALH